MNRVALSLAVAVLLSLEAHAQCGVERWSIKTGTDSGASSINLSTYTSNTIYNFYQSVRPSTVPSNSRVAPRETTQYRVSGTLTKYVRESDSDYHLVITDTSGRTMIVEIPSPNCVGSGSPFGTGIAHARSQFDARLTATTSFKSTSIPVTIKGIGFWDYLHGQTGVAPNGIEVHPVLDIVFNSPKTGDEGVPLPDLVLPRDVVLDNDGGRVHVYRGGEAIGDVLFHGGPVIENPRLEILFVGDHWTDAARGDVLRTARAISGDPRFQDLARYGVGTFGMAVDSRLVQQRLSMTAAGISTQAAEMNDLDVQRALSSAIDAGRIQLNDENAVYLVMLDPTINAAVGETRDWLSYHSQFHPTDLAMSYSVIRGGLDETALREAMWAGVVRTLVNPAGNGWY